MNKLSHTDSEGKARMVDVSGKKEQLRIAVAHGHITMAKDTLKLIQANNMKKGDVLTVAEIAGIQAAKMTGSLIPLCHPLTLSQVTLKATPNESGINIKSEVRCIGQTGVEMEALTAVSVALLTVYDMCKAVDKKMIIEKTQLISKTKHDLT